MTKQDISTAPKGYFKEVPYGNKGKTRTIHIPEKFLTLTSDGRWTFSYWVAHAERWCMFTKDCPPKHWWPLPDIPEEYLE